MPSDVSIRCSCGSLRGVARQISGGRGNRVVCYCDDCQAFGHFLERAAEILDPNGGTDIFQMSPARLEITAGREHLACVQLRPNGLLRWHTNCCNTPIGNTLAKSHVPFVGVIATCMDHASDDRKRDDVLGEIRDRVWGCFAKGDRSKLDAHNKGSAGMLLRLGPMLLWARLSGDHKKSPFFDADTGNPRATPRVLTPAELAGVEAARDA